MRGSALLQRFELLQGKARPFAGSVMWMKAAMPLSCSSDSPSRARLALLAVVDRRAQPAHHVARDSRRGHALGRALFTTSPVTRCRVPLRSTRVFFGCMRKPSPRRMLCTRASSTATGAPRRASPWAASPSPGERQVVRVARVGEAQPLRERRHAPVQAQAQRVGDRRRRGRPLRQRARPLGHVQRLAAELHQLRAAPRWPAAPAASPRSPAARPCARAPSPAATSRRGRSPSRPPSPPRPRPGAPARW